MPRSSSARDSNYANECVGEPDLFVAKRLA
jgi:hypothetical protein